MTFFPKTIVAEKQVLRIKGRVLDQATETFPEKTNSIGNGSPVNNN